MLNSTKSWASRFSRDFFAWWGRELFAALPAALRRKLYTPAGELLLQVSSKGVHILFAADDESKDLGLFALDEQGRAACQKKLTTELISKAKPVLVLNQQQCVHRQIFLPAQAAANLRSVMAFELDRHTPFKVETTCFDVKRVNNTVTEGKIAVYLAATPLERLQPLLTDLSFFDIKPAVATFSKNPDELRGSASFNLLPQHLRPTGSKTGRVIAAGLAVLLLLEFLMVVGYPSIHAATETETLEMEISRLQKDVRTVKNLRSSIGKIRAQTESLIRRVDSKPKVADVLLELTERLPAHTWLTQMRVNGNRLQIDGYSGKASGLIQLLDDSALFEKTHFTSPITSNNSAQQAFKIGLIVVQAD